MLQVGHALQAKESHTIMHYNVTAQIKQSLYLVGESNPGSQLMT